MSFLIGSRPGSPRRCLGVLLLALCLGALAGFGGVAQGATSHGAALAATRVDVTETDNSIAMPGSLAAGSYEFAVRNAGTVVHDFVVSQNGGDVARSATIPPGGSATVTVTLQPGTAVFYCSVDGHRAHGMERTVQVT